MRKELNKKSTYLIIELGLNTRSGPSKLLHNSSSAEQQTQMNTQRSHIEAGLDAYPENGHLFLLIELDKLTIIDSTNTQISLDSGNDRRSLKDCAREGLESLLHTSHVVDGRVEAHDADVLFAGALLRLGETRGAVYAHDERARHFRVECARVTGLLHAQDAFYPRDYFVRRRVYRLIQVDAAGFHVLLD